MDSLGPQELLSARLSESPSQPGDGCTIAAIIPLYNGGRWIAETLSSVLRQTRPADEIIVVDDGSNDGGPAIVREIAALHPVTLLSKPNGGQSTARNHGARHCTSELLAFLDQDDAWYPEHLKRLEAAYDARDTHKIGWAYSNVDQIDECGRLVCRQFLTRLGAPHPKLDLFTCLDRDMFVLPSAALIDRRAFEEVGGFDERLSGYEDDDLFLRMFVAGYANVYLDTPLSQWRIYATSASRGPRMARSRMIYAAKLIEAYPDEAEMSLYYAREMIAPRFVRNVLVDFNRGLKAGSPEKCRDAVEDLKVLVGHLGRSQRLPWRLLITLLSRYRVARMAWRLAWSGSVIRSACRFARHRALAGGQVFQLR
jgi:glycosyltransferase involved in cell wall biosynthesis